ncbi:16S rRNA m(7)G-527 methyltransferase [Litoreibacter meonggei]|uniref:Ribosomal RNA small subunit methyltransferase G n=1 Tax=Litoreibacter meonggei TaxID=1049199 RepID=A0A497WSY5_9RHOB|nr:16S rRNA (guanine(527)-N(7))-methyltransferase RsmG [Litoreibacter meonggei]RLJ52103.1 16S rRNA m(7)G-527 methyltransferase [Litoreibacter meonggei]
MMEQDQFAEQHDVSRETMTRLRTYDSLLRKWTTKINLVSKSTLPELWTRHFADSAQVFDSIPSDALSLCDFGAGGGFPGLVIAALAHEKLPNLTVSLVESDVRKASFLVTAAREMGVQVVVHAERVEALPAQNADVITARALASLSDLLLMADLHLRERGTALFLKGERHQEELDIASTMWDFKVDKHKSTTNTGSALLAITNLRRAV